MPGFDDTRLQTVPYDPGSPVRLVTFPDAPLTVILIPNDPIEGAQLSDRSAFEVSIVGRSDSLAIKPLRPDAVATLAVNTRARRYQFQITTGRGLTAAYTVRFLNPQSPPAPTAIQPAFPTAPSGNYRLTGDKVIRPARIADDGQRTFIEWDPSQSLPAVFGIGASGAEEAVNGHMRSGIFTIDRIYTDLVFRIDRSEAKARRLPTSSAQ